MIVQKSLILSFFLFFIITVSCNEEVLINDETESSLEDDIIINEKDSNDIIIEKLIQSLITNRNVEQKLKEYGEKNPETSIVMYTKYGKLKFTLYKNTPLHRANFVMLAKRKFYDNTLFYRIIDNFMIQGGNSDNPELNSKLNEIGAYRIPNEISSSRFHKKGALAMAVSPEEQRFGKKSSSINFYIIEGRKMNSSYFKMKEEEGKKFSKKQKEIYSTKGGAPHLDGNYTVFGELVSGFSTLNRISKIKKDKYDWPIKDFYIDSIRAF
ncbi:peptidylprolyl isomerase [Flavobacteriales bacterium]|nr:peptidylprolyl isomerase [Flavobacteriales bacterium]